MGRFKGFYSAAKQSRVKLSNPNVRRIVIGTIGFIVLVGLLWASKAMHLGPRLRLGYRADSILAGATRVETFRVMSPVEAGETESGHKRPTFSPTAPQIDGCYITATAEEQGPVLAQKISRILLDEGTYTSGTLGCITVPGVIFRVWKGSQSLDVVLCFQCGEIYTVTHNGNDKGTHGVYTLMAGHSRSEFARLANEAFPNDSSIQAL